MNRPPLLMGLAFGKRKFRLWLPLFLLFPFLLVILLLLAPFLLLGAIFLWSFGWGKTLLLFIPVMLEILSELRGLEIDVDSGEEKVFISFK